MAPVMNFLLEGDKKSGKSRKILCILITIFFLAMAAGIAALGYMYNKDQQ